MANWQTTERKELYDLIKRFPENRYQFVRDLLRGALRDKPLYGVVPSYSTLHTQIEKLPRDKILAAVNALAQVIESNDSAITLQDLQQLLCNLPESTYGAVFGVLYGYQHFQTEWEEEPGSRAWLHMMIEQLPDDKVAAASLAVTALAKRNAMDTMRDAIHYASQTIHSGLEPYDDLSQTFQHFTRQWAIADAEIFMREFAKNTLGELDPPIQRRSQREMQSDDE